MKLLRILLVDDDPIANFVNQALLEKIDVVEKVMIANNGKVALQLIEQLSQTGPPVDLILLDINMPVMNGIEFMQLYNDLELEHKDAVKVIILTTSNHPRDLESFAQLPISGFMNKPLTTKKITELLQEHFAV